MVIEENPQILTDKRTVGLVCRPDRPEIEPFANQVAEFLISRDLNVQIDPGSCNVTNDKAQSTRIEDMDADFVVTIGGDGTILYTLSTLKNRETPLFCINRGFVGFLTESDPESTISALEKVLENECVIEHNVNIGSGVGDRIFEDALNEVYVVSKTPGRLLTFQVFLDGVQVDYGRADGAMLATPVGSSAYALAAGGSILAPNVNGLIFVPVCPPRFELKSIVIPTGSTLELELVKPGASGLAIIDGQTRWDVEPLETVWMKKSEVQTRFIRMYDNYYDRLNTRLVPRTL
ncbi:MAG: NAD(+)/NADH kinase [Candidatus Thorarchaeota archaeon]|nr:NAD(+)/NADH kinase [Candidatus Thorarchaeota archaeon]